MDEKEWKSASRFKSAEDSPGFLLWRTHMIWRRQIEEALYAFDLTHIQFVTLAGLSYLTKQGVIVVQKELAKFIRCDVTMISQVLRSLEKKGFVQRFYREGNEKSKFPKLTEEGNIKLKESLQAVEDVDLAFFSALEGDLPNFQKSLKILTQVK